MNRTRDKMAPGARIFGNALTYITNASKHQEPRPIGLKTIDNPETTSLESPQCSARNNREPRPPSSLLLEETDNSSIASFEISSVPARYPMDSYSPYYPFEAPTNCSIRQSMHLSEVLAPLPSLPTYQENASFFNSTYSLSSHEKLRQSLYSLTATDLCRMMSGRQPDSTSGCNSPMNSQDSGFQLSDDSNSSETSINPEYFTSMPYYHVANTPELYSTEQQVLDEVSPTEKKPEPMPAPHTLISGRVNRRNVHRIQGANTSISSSGRNLKTSRIDRANLPKSVVRYSSSEDSGVDVSTYEDLSTSPSYTECKGCESLSKRVSLADVQKKWKTLPDYGRTSFLSLKCKPGFIDSHCHLDFLLGRQNYNGTYTEYMQKHRGTYPASYEGCVAVFCHPNTFHKTDMWQRYLGEKGVWGAFGCHPHHSKFYDSAVEHHLTQAIQHSKVRALGEIGLDYSNRNDCSCETQQRVFRRQLKIALQEKLPLVIHCRDANQDTMRILKEIVPKDYTIHLHCFTDDWDWAQKWLKEFPNLCIGITNLVTYFSAERTHIVAERIPLNRLLLETDAPYFLPRKVQKTRDMKYSHPGMAIHVAAQIAEIRGVSLKEIIHHTRQNTKMIYGI